MEQNQALNQQMVNQGSNQSNGYMPQTYVQPVKSATTAGLLGIFLGGFGVHSFYLGDKKKGIIHCCLAGGSILISIIAGVVLPAVMTWRALLTWGTIFGILSGIAWLVAVGNGIWGLVEGIIILSQGDAGLARKGYNVAPQPMYNQPMYGQPMQSQPMQGQPMQGQMNNGQMMPNQPMQEPMNQASQAPEDNQPVENVDQSGSDQNQNLNDNQN